MSPETLVEPTAELPESTTEGDLQLFQDPVDEEATKPYPKPTDLHTPNTTYPPSQSTRPSTPEISAEEGFSHPSHSAVHDGSECELVGYPTESNLSLASRGPKLDPDSFLAEPELDLVDKISLPRARSRSRDKFIAKKETKDQGVVDLSLKETEEPQHFVPEQGTSVTQEVIEPVLTSIKAPKRSKKTKRKELKEKKGKKTAVEDFPDTGSVSKSLSSAVDELEESKPKANSVRGQSPNPEGIESPWNDTSVHALKSLDHCHLISEKEDSEQKKNSNELVPGSSEFGSHSNLEKAETKKETQQRSHPAGHISEDTNINIIATQCNYSPAIATQESDCHIAPEPEDSGPPLDLSSALVERDPELSLSLEEEGARQDFNPKVQTLQGVGSDIIVVLEEQNIESFSNLESNQPQILAIELFPGVINPIIEEHPEIEEVLFRDELTREHALEGTEIITKLDISQEINDSRPDPTRKLLSIEPKTPSLEVEVPQNEESRYFDFADSDSEQPLYNVKKEPPVSASPPTVEDCPEIGESLTKPSHISTQGSEHIANHTNNISAMALQDRSIIASQLSDALALFNSFDESVKSLVTRLQSNENNFVVKPEHEGTASKVPAPFHVPYTRNSQFHGRFSTLSQIFGMWRPQQRCRVSVVGLGGVGKTELMIEFVYRVRQVSPSTPIFWFGPDDIRSKDGPASATPGMQLEDWLRGHHDPGSLIVVDSGDRSDLFELSSQGGSLIDQLRNIDGTVITVSRNSRQGNLIAPPHEICQVKALELDACVSLMCDNLESYAHDNTTEREVQNVVESLTCMPRAIIQVAKLINITQMTVAQFYEMFSTGEAFQLRLFGKIEPYSSPNNDLSIIGRGVFDLKSFRKSHREPSRLLYQIYYLGGKSVPFRLVSTDDPLDRILLMLNVRAHFMIIEDPSNQTFSIHPLVYLAMRKALGAELPFSDERDAFEERKWYDDVVLAFSKHYPDANCESRAWWKECFTHLVTGFNLHNDSLRVAIAKIYHRESSFFKRKGIFSEAVKMASLAKSVLPDPVPPECLAIVQDQVALLDFLAQYREVHEMLRGLTMDIGHPGNLWKKSMMAKLEVADCANRYDSAIEIFRQVRTAGEAANADKLDLSNAIDDLAMALMQKGKYREAVIECRKALTERSTRLGSLHIDTLSSCHNLAEILHKDGKFEEAHRYVQEALRGRENALGSDHPETLYSKLLRARIQISKATMTSEFDEAEAVLMHSIERLSVKLSPTHPIVMTCKSEIARIMLARGKYESAEQMNRLVLAAREQGPWLEPATHPDTMNSRNQLAEVIRLKDGSKEADNISERCLTERTVVLTNGSLTGDDFHPDQLVSLHNRAIILSGLGQHLAALQKIDLALLGRKAILGERHPDYFITMTWKGEIMRAQLHRYQSERNQTLDTIENLHKNAYEGLSWLLGSEHHSSLQCATHMALAKRERGSPASSEAEGLFRQIHCAYQHNMGDFHPETLKSKGRLAEAMRAASPRWHHEAKKLWRDSCGGLTKIYGFDAHVTSNAYKGYEKFLRNYPDP